MCIDNKMANKFHAQKYVHVNQPLIYRTNKYCKL